MDTKTGITPGKGHAANRLIVVKDGNGWRVQDVNRGHLHSARIKDKARAQRQADTMNARLDSLGRLKKEGE